MSTHQAPSNNATDQPAARLAELRQAIHDQNISYGQIAELASLVQYIEPGDVELLEWAGMPEHDDGEQQYAVEARLFNGEPHTVVVDSADQAREMARLNPGSSWYPL